MIDNFDKITPLLNWRTEDDFYFLQILQRKKDHKAGKVNGTNNNSRLIKAYYVKNQDHFDFIKPEVIELCKVFNARAGINLNRRSFKKMSLQHIKKCTDQLLNEDYHKAYQAYSSVVGAYSNDNDKKWIIDIDLPGEEGKRQIREILEIIDKCRPEGWKGLATIPSKSGFHLITSPFDVMDFNVRWNGSEDEKVEIHKNNPTNLYIP